MKATQKACGQTISRLWGAINLGDVSLSTFFILSYKQFLIANNTKLIGFYLWQNIRGDSLVVQKHHKVYNSNHFHIIWIKQHFVFFIWLYWWVVSSSAAFQSSFCFWCVSIWDSDIHLIPAVPSVLIFSDGLHYLTKFLHANPWDITYLHYSFRKKKAQPAVAQFDFCCKAWHGYRTLQISFSHIWLKKKILLKIEMNCGMYSILKVPQSSLLGISDK